MEKPTYGRFDSFFEEGVFDLALVIEMPTYGNACIIVLLAEPGEQAGCGSHHIEYS